MANWYNIVIPIAAVVLGFFLGILRQKLFEKKVSLSHKLDAPAVFSVIPPQVSFQNLKITNRGKLPAKNLRINLRDELVKQYDVIYKPITEEPYKEEKREGIVALKFETLLPEEELIISFKSANPIPEGFLINIKSDEMVSKKESEQRRKSMVSEIVGLLSYAVVAAGVFALLNSFWDSRSARLPAESLQKHLEQQTLSLNIMKDKPIYQKGDKVEITYQIINIKKDILRDIFGELKIPGFDLNNDQKYMEKKWLESEGQIIHKVAFSIPKDVPSGKHKIILEVHASSLEERFEKKAETFFEVQ